MKYFDARREFERNYWLKLLSSTQGDVSAAAREAGIRRQEVYVHVHRHHLEALLRGQIQRKVQSTTAIRSGWSRTIGGAKNGRARSTAGKQATRPRETSRAVE